MESPNTSPQAVELKPGCSRQAHLNRPDTGPGHKSTEPGSIFTVLRFPFVICPFRSADAKSSDFEIEISIYVGPEMAFGRFVRKGAYDKTFIW